MRPRDPEDVIFPMVLDTDLLVESTLNPRRTYDQQALEELTASVKARGILVPLLVRPISTEHGMRYEVVAGSRRLRAARAAGLAQVPVQVRSLSDDEALETALVDNLQRTDLHPLEEAQTYRMLLEAVSGDLEALSAKVSKPTAFLVRRLKLLELSGDIRNAFEKGIIGTGHAELLARLQPADQARAFTDGVFTRELSSRQRTENVVRSVAALRAWLQANILLDLLRAPWKHSDATLLPAAGACANCPKRTGANPTLFADLAAKKGTCTDPACFSAKMTAYIDRTVAKLTAKGEQVARLSTDWSYGGYNSARDPGGILARRFWSEAGKDVCSHAVSGIIVDGENIGHTLRVCVAEGCPVHRGYSVHAQPTAAEQAARRRKARAQKVEAAFRQALFTRVIAAVPPHLAAQDLRAIAEATYKRLWHTSKLRVAKWAAIAPGRTHWGGKDYDKPGIRYIRGLDARGLARFLMALALAPELELPTYGKTRPEALRAVANRYHIDLKAIRKSVEKTPRPTRSRARARGDSRKKPTTRRSRPVVRP